MAPVLPTINRTIAPVQNPGPAHAEACSEWLAIMPAIRRTSAALGRAA